MCVCVWFETLSLQGLTLSLVFGVYRMIPEPRTGQNPENPEPHWAKPYKPQNLSPGFQGYESRGLRHWNWALG